MTRPLLIEIGTEELPASFVRAALSAMPGIARGLLEGARVAHGEIRALGTPRRLSLLVDALVDAQPDLEAEVTGPPVSVAIGADGKPTKAGEGFARKQGVDPSALRVVTTDKGQYVAVTRREKGRPVREVLPSIVAELAAKIPFAKSMRWGAGDVAFGRPIHWLVVLHGDEVIPAEVAGVRSGRSTRGHRFLAPEPFELASAERYVDALREAHVLVDTSEREARMTALLEAAARDAGGALVPDAFLVGECASLVEEPFVVPGRFDDAFLELPESLVVSVMRNHQRYFAVSAPGGGRLLPRYLNVVNTANDPAAIAKGNDRVLVARLRDARFFVTEDQKTPLGDRTPRLDRVVFQTKLGSVGDKVRRIESLAASLLDGGDAELARRVATLCKADLVTLAVGEFPELQGEMGAYYARAEGVEPRVADAIRDHYLPRGASDSLPTDRVAAAVAIADRMDTLVGCFGIGLVPTGSADPYALRRAALGIVRIAVDGPLDISLSALVPRAYAAHAPGVLAPAADVAASLDAFFRGRLASHFASFGADVVDACLGAWDGGSLRDLHARLVAVSGFLSSDAAESLAVAFKRAFNIAKDAAPGEMSAALLAEPAEKELAERFLAIRPKLDAHVAARAYADALSLVGTELRAPIDRFFETVFVMVDDAAIRDNRLRLLRAIADSVTRMAHFHLLQRGETGASRS